MPVAHSATGSRAHTVLPTRCWCGRSCVRAGVAAGLVVGVFARWVVGVWCLRWGCVRLGCLRACLCALAWGVVGQCGPAAPPCPACLLACVLTLWRGRCLVCARLVCARWAEGGQVGAGQRCPAPCCVALGCFGRPVARKERKWVGVLSWCANARAYAHAERERGASGRAIAGLAGGVRGVLGWLSVRTVVVWAWVACAAGACGVGDNRPGEQNWRYRAGAGCAPGRGWVLVVGARGGWVFWWWRVGGCGLSVGVGAQEGGGVRGRGCVWGWCFLVVAVLVGGWVFWWWLVG